MWQAPPSSGICGQMPRAQSELESPPVQVPHDRPASAPGLASAPPCEEGGRRTPDANPPPGASPARLTQQALPREGTCKSGRKCVCPSRPRCLETTNKEMATGAPHAGEPGPLGRQRAGSPDSRRREASQQAGGPFCSFSVEQVLINTPHISITSLSADH